MYMTEVDTQPIFPISDTMVFLLNLYGSHEKIARIHKIQAATVKRHANIAGCTNTLKAVLEAKNEVPNKIAIPAPPGNFSFHPYFLTPSILLLLSSLIYNFISIKQFTIFPVFISIIAFVF